MCCSKGIPMSSAVKFGMIALRARPISMFAAARRWNGISRRATPSFRRRAGSC
jgi:hypothetical protein